MQTQHIPRDNNRACFRVTASNLGVRHALQQTCTWAGGFGVAGTDLANIELVLGEVLNNIVEHALPHQPDSCFELDISIQPQGIHVQTTDNGHPMPDERIPSSKLPKTDVPLHEMPEGGFGWPLFLMLADDVTYTRRGQHNILQFGLPFSN